MRHGGKMDPLVDTTYISKYENPISTPHLFISVISLNKGRAVVAEAFAGKASLFSKLKNKQTLHNTIHQLNRSVSIQLQISVDFFIYNNIRLHFCQHSSTNDTS